ncbi:TonB-dependent siderophore receptor [Comamonas serinivorans]|uniref:TonB-dependent siderophore receptor n=1 Tax=Comamonas serinivorans TaxID=1082851 RepID=A0A1Y0ESC8_9BURK|nr:TonB-dependent receptor [Comamonas serinivorans]ARU06209.1 TonB-dependent siderophore receptor [Comamonas serinivorans]
MKASLLRSGARPARHPIALAVLSLCCLPALAQQAGAAGSGGTLPSVEVSATLEANELPGVAPGGQAAKGARLGVLGNVPIVDAPVSVNAYTRQLIQDTVSYTLADVLESDPSVRFTTNNGHMLENFTIRGLDVSAMDIATNGLYGIAPANHVPVEMLERVEVLRGPSALLSGMAPAEAVGGTINLVTKRAGAKPLTELTTSFASDAYAQVHADVSRRFGADQRLGLRVNGVYGDGKSGAEDEKQRRQLGALALDWQGDKARLWLDVYSNRDSIRNGSPGMFNFARSLGYLLAPPKGDVNMFRDTQGIYKNTGAMVRGEVDFNDQWQGYAAVGGSEGRGDGLMFGTRTIVTGADGASQGFVYNVSTKSRRLALDVGAIGKFSTGAVQHRLQVAYNLVRYKEGTANRANTGYAQNIYNPVTPVFPAAPAEPAYNVDDKLQSFVVADTMTAWDERAHLMLGARLQKVQQLGGYSAQRISPSLGVVVKPWGDTVSLFGNYMEGLQAGQTVGVGYANEGETFKPTRTKQLEVGVKLQQGALTHTLSAFQIKRATLIDVNNTLTEGGMQRLRGLEWNVFGQVLPQLSLLGGVAHNRAKQLNTGLDSFAVPDWTANLGLQWSTPVPGLAVGGRVVYTGAQWSDSGNKVRVPSWHRFDLNAKYETRVGSVPLRLNAAIDNVTNKRYWTGVFSDGFVMPGAPRTFKLAATVSF